MKDIFKKATIKHAFMILFFVPGVCFAGKQVILRNGKEEYRIGQFTQILKDPLRNLNIDSVAFGTSSNEFRELKSDEIDIGHTKDAVWIRFTLKNESSKDYNWILSEGFPIIDRVNFYIPESGGKFEELTAGIDFPMSSRRLRSRKIIFPFSLKSGEQKTFYMRLQS